MSIADISLINQDRLLLVCNISSVLITLVLMKQTRRWYKTRFPYHVLGSVALGIIAWTFLWHAYPEDGIPLKLIIWVAISLFALSILFTVKRSKGRLAIAGSSAFFMVLLSLLLTNNYFQYYPTLGSLVSGGVAPSATTGIAVETTGHSIAPSASVESSYTPPANQPATGELQSIAIPGTMSHFTPRQEFVYIPPAARTTSPPKLPVLMLLSGVPGNPGDWKDRLNLQTALDDFATQHRGLAPIVIVADQTGGDGFTSTGCVDSTRGNAETYLTIDIPAYMKANYQTFSAPEGWAIGGVSDGGACSTVLAIRHPDIFSVFMSLSGETSPSIESKQEAINSLFNGSAKNFNAYDALLTLQSKHASNLYAHTAGWLALGRDEQQPLVQANRTLFSEAKADNIDMTLETLPGHHGFGLWQRAFVDALPWISHRTGLTQ